MIWVNTTTEIYHAKAIAGVENKGWKIHDRADANNCGAKNVYG